MKEIYAYSADGYLQTVRVATGTQATNTSETFFLIPTAASGSGVLQASYTRDAMGRVTGLVEYQSDGTTVAYDRTVTYNARSQVTTEDTHTRGDDGRVTHNYTTNYYYAVETAAGSGQWIGASSASPGAVYMGGAVTRIYTQVDEITSGGSFNDLADTRSTYTFTWWDGAEQTRMDHDADFGSSSNNVWYSIRTLDESGNLIAATIGGTGSGPDARARSLSFINDANGLILQRDETDSTTTTTGNPRELHYYFNGMRIGDISNNGTSNTD